jgi:hypothetical protein
LLVPAGLLQAGAMASFYLLRSYFAALEPAA